MKARKYFLVLAITLLIESCNSDVSVTPNDLQYYVDLKYPPLPRTLTRGPGQVISPSSSPHTWVVEILADGKSFMLWLARLLYHDQDGESHWQATDIIVLPPPSQNQEIIVSACLFEGLLDPEIVVLAHVDDESLKNRYLLNPSIILAWRANQVTGKLEQMSTEKIECFAETFLSYPW